MYRTLFFSFFVAYTSTFFGIDLPGHFLSEEERILCLSDISSFKIKMVCREALKQEDEEFFFKSQIALYLKRSLYLKFPQPFSLEITADRENEKKYLEEIFPKIENSSLFTLNVTREKCNTKNREISRGLGVGDGGILFFHPKISLDDISERQTKVLLSYADYYFPGLSLFADERTKDWDLLYVKLRRDFDLLDTLKATFHEMVIKQLYPTFFEEEKALDEMFLKGEIPVCVYKAELFNLLERTSFQSQP